MRKVLLFTIISCYLTAQTGNIDASFNTTVNNGFNNMLYDLILSDNNKILVAGSHSHYNGTSTGRLTQLNNNGTVDTSFNTGGSGVSGDAFSVLRLTNEKLLVGGFFSNYNSIAVSNFIRLNANGTLDNTFQFTNTNNIAPKAIAVQSDNKIIIGGNSFAPPRLQRLNENGSLDQSFTVGTGLDGPVNQIAIQSDGKIIVGGNFTTFNGTPVKSLLRLNSDGTLDSSFNTGTGLFFQNFNNAYVNSIKIQADGKILIGGAFVSYNNTPCSAIIRLNTDGSIDSSFNTGSGFTNNGIIPIISAIHIQQDSKILVSGGFRTYNGTNHRNIIRLNPNGSHDNTIDFGAGLIFTPAARFAIQSDGQILAIGDFTTYKTTETKGKIIRIQNTVLSTNEVFQNSKISIYPNPSQNEVFVKATDELRNYEIHNMSGQIIMKAPFKNGQKNILINHLSTGTYLIKINTVKDTFSSKLIKN